jgi:hypothetical protein
VYRYGLTLQELAGRLGSQPADQLALLNQAAEVYLEASRLAGDRHAAVLYNWAVALTDIARLVQAQEPEEAYECLTAAANKYAQSLAVQSDNPQACNNWGLCLQSLSSLRPPAERPAYLHHSLSKFRRAIRLRPDFDRACYNMGTVLYAHACALQEALLASQEQAEAAQLTAVASGSGRQGSLPLSSPTAGARGGGQQLAAERAIQSTFAHAAQYISLAYAMQPGKQVYADSLSAVQRLLPLPWLRSGPLLAVHPQTAGTPGEQWVSCWFALDHNGLQAVRPPTAFAGQHGLPSAPLPIGYELGDVADARRVNDPSLPAGAPFWLGLQSKPRGVYLVAADEDDAEGWVDAILLLSHLRRSGRLGGIKAALAVR